MLHLACAKEFDGLLDAPRGTDDNEIVAAVKQLVRPGCRHGVLATNDRNNGHPRPSSDARVTDRAIPVNRIGTNGTPVDDKPFDALLQFG